jgi:hypothetical protein
MPSEKSSAVIVIYEPSARRYFSPTSDEGASASFVGICRIRLLASKFVQCFLKGTLCLICRVPCVNRWRLSVSLPKCQFNS